MYRTILRNGKIIGSDYTMKLFIITYQMIPIPPKALQLLEI